jgi:hypothetical protein
LGGSSRCDFETIAVKAIAAAPFNYSAGAAGQLTIGTPTSRLWKELCSNNSSAIRSILVILDAKRVKLEQFQANDGTCFFVREIRVNKRQEL